MPKYLIAGQHPPNLCPSANETVRKMSAEGAGQIPELAEKLGVKLEATYVPMNNHMVFAAVEADDMATVREFAFQSRLGQWNTMRSTRSRPWKRLYQGQRAPDDLRVAGADRQHPGGPFLVRSDVPPRVYDNHGVPRLLAGRLISRQLQQPPAHQGGGLLQFSATDLVSAGSRLRHYRVAITPDCGSMRTRKPRTSRLLVSGRCQGSNL